VRLYLSGTHGVALHRMAVISYGEGSPVADNGTREGRALNRRVVLVVLK
jgi:outer membrane protein OmpA-like peptidoglycan-associated protein